MAGIKPLGRQSYALSRRRFLKSALYWGGAVALPVVARNPFVKFGTGTAASRHRTLAPLPPGIMLHSRHGVNLSSRGFLPVFTTYVRQEGFATMTYRSWLNALLAGDPLPEKPLIISIDDLTMVVGNPGFQDFQNMHDYLHKQGMVAVFGVVTHPGERQDAAWWAMVAEWTREGFELATHTSEHTNFNQRDGSPRDDFTQEMFDAEIVDSARMIEAQTGQAVTTLITPYGSGFTRSTQTLHPQIVASCRQAGIKIVAGITDGRSATSLEDLADPDFVLYTGRTSPGPYDNAISAIYNVNQWNDP